MTWVDSEKSGLFIITAQLQVALGTAAYSGTCGVMKDGDEAYRWLSRAANKLASLPPSLNTGPWRLTYPKFGQCG